MTHKPKRSRSSWRRPLLAILFLFWVFFGYWSVTAFRRLPATKQASREDLMLHLNGLQRQMRDENAASRMQQVFPEGACFTLTLYGLAWLNAVADMDPHDPVRERALHEAVWVLGEYDKKYVSHQFGNTEVRNGVFWLGQHNLLLATLLKNTPPAKRDPKLVEQFHKDSKDLAAAFLKSPARHLNSYGGECWPADNVTALLSLCIHDDLYQIGERAAYLAWKEWTKKNCDPGTGLPPGRIDTESAERLEPSRGCANSWIITLLSQADPEFASELYNLHVRHFGISRLGCRVFREYPIGSNLTADIDSGPILFGAGFVATGVGMAAARTTGDWATARDIYSLAGSLGFRWTRDATAGKTSLRETRYLRGMLPTGDAFLTWGLSMPSSTQGENMPVSMAAWTVRRLPVLGIFALLTIAIGFLWRSNTRQRTRQTP